MEHRQQEPLHAPPVHTIPRLRWGAGKLHKMEALLQWADQSADQNWGHCLAVSTHRGENSGRNGGLIFSGRVMGFTLDWPAA